MSRTESIRRWLFRPRVLLIAAMLPLLVWGLDRFRRSLAELEQRPEYTVGWEAIELVDPPRWIPVDFVPRTAARAKLPDRLPLLSDDLVEDVARAFAASPWVAKVERVRKTADRRVVVDLVFRRPVAVVRRDSVTYPVDVEGVLLPAEDFSPAEIRRHPAIVDVRSMPQGPAGTPWGDPAVTAAARLAEAVAEKWRHFSLTAIRLRTGQDVGDASDPVFELVTEAGSVIVWGRAPGTDHPGELSAGQKLGRLEDYLADFGSFDRPHGPYEIDIRHWREISRRPVQVGVRPRSSR